MPDLDKNILFPSNFPILDITIDITDELDRHFEHITTMIRVKERTLRKNIRYLQICKNLERSQKLSFKIEIFPKIFSVLKITFIFPLVPIGYAQVLPYYQNVSIL